MAVARLLGTVLVITLVAAMTGCGRVERTPIGTRPTRSAPAPSDSGWPDPTSAPDDGYPTANPGYPTELPTPTAPPDTVAVSCAGKPTGGQVIAALRRDRNLLPAGVTPVVVTGPLCAGTWQYTVLSVPDHDALQVVTRGAAASLTVVTAGTYVCTPAVTMAVTATLASTSVIRAT